MADEHESFALSRWPGPVQQISSGGSPRGVTISGAAECWGSNGIGQLGNGTMTDSLTPVPVSGLNSGVAALVGGRHTCRSNQRRSTMLGRRVG